MYVSQLGSVTYSMCRACHLHAAKATSRSSLVVRHASSQARASALLDRIIRVDHAGELGADRIYAGQMAVLGKTDVGPVIQEMWDQEKHHRETFERLIPEHRVRPTVLLPIWNIAGFALGACTALLGKEGAMACTVAVEETIGGHYNKQIRQLLDEDPVKYEELLKTIQQFRDEELEHLDKGLEHDAEQIMLAYVKVGEVVLSALPSRLLMDDTQANIFTQTLKGAPMYSALSNVIKAGCSAAIWLSERI